MSQPSNHNRISMLRLLRSRRGTTLVELCVVMLLMAILGTMTIGFCVSASQVSASQIDNALSTADETQVRKMIDKWLAYFDNAKYYIGTADLHDLPNILPTDTSLKLYAQALNDMTTETTTVDEKEVTTRVINKSDLEKKPVYYIYVDSDHILHSNLPDGTELSCYTDSVTAISCERVTARKTDTEGNVTETTGDGIVLKTAETGKNSDGARLYFRVTCEEADSEPRSFVIVKGASLYSRCAGAATATTD